MKDLGYMTFANLMGGFGFTPSHGEKVKAREKLKQIRIIL